MLSYFKQADGVILNFDLTDRKSFLEMRNWISEVKDKSKCNIPMVLAGNKLDLCDTLGTGGRDNRKVSKKEAQQFANCHRINYYETSAKDGRGISELMEDIMG